jgi:O-antigen/teichoic acid export membrane protein
MHSFATLLTPFLGFGIQGAIIKFYPVFVNKKLDTHFLSFTMALATVSAVISTAIIALVYVLAKPCLYQIFANFALVEENKYSILILGYIFLYSSIFLFHATARFRIVIPDIINNIGLKIFLPLLILAIYFGILNRALFVPVIIIYFLLVCLALMIYLFRLDKHRHQPKILKLEKAEYKGLIAFMLFSVLNGLGISLALKIDIAMVGTMISKEAVGLYTIILTISNVMEIPAKAINQISAPVVSKSWANGEKQNILDIYRKSSVYGLIGGVFLFLILYFIWVDIITLMPGKLNLDIQTVLLIFTLLSMARIIDLVTGVNSVIISYSTDYRFHMFFLLILGCANIIMNYFFLIHFGLVGAALATCISYLIFNVIKYVFVKLRFGLTIEFGQHLYILIAGSIVFFLMYWIDIQLPVLINVLVKPLMAGGLYFFMIWKLNPGGEIRKFTHDFLTQALSLLPLKNIK